MPALTRLLCLLLAAPAAGFAQSSASPYDPLAAPQGRPGQVRGDPQLDAQAAYREARARCRALAKSERSACVAQAVRERDRASQRRRPSVEVRPASAASGAGP